MIEVTKANFAVVVENSDVPVVLDFWAPWCSPCKSLMPILEKLEEEYTGIVKVCKINVDDSPDLASKFQVRSVPTVLGLVDGEVQNTSVGFQGEKPLRDLIEAIKEG